jgi:CubicO group peptidase (beta-lactamase class C family)
MKVDLKKVLLVPVLAAVLFATACKADPLAARDETPDVEPPGTPVDTVAGDAAVKRLKELLAVVNSGNPAAMKAYLEANSVDFTGGAWRQDLLPFVLDLHRTSLGFDLMRVEKIGAQQIQPQLVGYPVGILRNKLTEEVRTLVVTVEPKAPHRITHLPALHPSLSVALVPPVPFVPLSEQQGLQNIGSYLKRLGDADVFSGVVVIARGGQPVLSQAYGFADRERKIPNTLSTPFLLGSINKLFTGLAIGQLVERGKLSYDDPLSKFLPDYPDPESAKRIKIKHLLSHTSGLPDGVQGQAYYDALDRLVTVQAMIDVAERKPPTFEPGTKWAYNNLGFELLGRVVEIAAGEDYYEYMMKHVFAPAGMTSTSFPLLPRNGVATVPMAYPYEIEFDGERLLFVNKLGADFRRGGPSGSGIGTALDLIALANALPSGRVVKPETFQLHSSAKPELASSNYGYGFAVGMRRVNNRLLVGHGGAAFGQCTEFGELRGTPYTMVVLSNLTIGTCKSVAGQIMRVLAAAS